ncbi:ABC transporter ATP-binding protein [Peterkaempfera griseoplana]|uniref:ABC transporter ATP-binding protein n=1 Tax=Peterkaempfera griseoplana TaxID=66896 RepID=UPI0007C8388C|nr:ABC transporter ATP-binding protein [Peterkaempfera griseoplana]
MSVTETDEDTATLRGTGVPAIECASLVRIYRTAKLEVQALQGLDLRVAEGEFTALVGASGSGKSTLLGILSGLDSPTAGSVKVAGRELAGLSRRERLAYRRETVGFIWQSPPRNLLPHLTSLENVALPQTYLGVSCKARRTRALDLLETMGVAYCRDRVLGQMSGGEQQRVAIAVALANKPAVLLADEPTGELDSDSAAQVLAALREAGAEHGVTTLIVTHDEGVSGQVQRTIAIRDGRTATETLRPGANGARPAGPGEDPDEHEAFEYAVVDRSGRLQLPPEFTEPLGIRDLVRLTHETGHVGVWPEPGKGAGGPENADGAATADGGSDGGAAGSATRSADDPAGSAQAADERVAGGDRGRPITESGDRS